jgi:5-methyltetrahydropteroyltriglutamate--homocysteine methyltransferase
MTVLECLRNKKVHVGVIDLRDLTPETPEAVAERLRDALEHVPAERVVVAPDCGMKYLPRDVAYAKLAAMVAGAKIVRGEIG